MSAFIPGSAEAARAEAILDILAAGLDVRPRADGPSLAGGYAGRALFYAYLAAHRPGAGHEDTAMRLLDHAIDGVGPLGRDLSLYSGVGGIAFAAEHVRRLLTAGGDDPCADLDPLYVQLLGRPWVGQYDLVSGICGLGVYALERLPGEDGRRMLEAIVRRLGERAVPTGGGLSWWTDATWLPEPDRPRGPGYYNCGVAHGVPAVIALLGAACGHDVAAEEAGRLLDGALAWLWAQDLGPDSPSVFPFYVGPETPADPARLAWCYGDPGVLAAVVAAARRAGRAADAARAVALARRSALRRMDGAGIVEPTLCHGAAGLALAFRRLHDASGEAVFAEASRYWLTQTLALTEHAGLGLYTRQPAEGESVHTDRRGALMGGAGVGLVLLSALGPVAPAWDRFLMTSVR